jgi:hypothetical protein
MTFHCRSFTFSRIFKGMEEEMDARLEAAFKR